MGQVGSFTRAIKVQQLEAALKVAISAERDATPDKTEVKSKAVHNLASRLLAARIQVLRSRIADMRPKGTKDTGARAKIAALQNGGTAAILREFDA